MVWQAEQTEPIRREVALKIIKPGMDSREIIARFEAEWHLWPRMLRRASAAYATRQKTPGCVFAGEIRDCEGALSNRIKIESEWGSCEPSDE